MVRRCSARTGNRRDAASVVHYHSPLREGAPHGAGIGDSKEVRVSGLARWAAAIAIATVAVAGCDANAGDLQVGECFDDPGSVEEVSDVQRHPCTEEHSAEVFFVGSMT